MTINLSIKLLLTAFHFLLRIFFFFSSSPSLCTGTFFFSSLSVLRASIATVEGEKAPDYVKHLSAHAGPQVFLLKTVSLPPKKLTGNRHESESG